MSSFFLSSVVQDPEVARYDLVLEHGARRDVDLLALVGDDDHFAAEGDVPAEGHVAGHGEVVEVHEVGDAAQALKELANLLDILAIKYSRPV